MTDFKNNSLEEKKKKRKQGKKQPYTSKTITTGYPALNTMAFNKRMGTYTPGFGDAVPGAVPGGSHSCDGGSCTTSSAECGTSASGGCCEGLTEAKRYVRRYYIRPQNIFCSNKAEIVKALIDLDDANCSVYTLNNLGDEKDVSKLMNSDIIYYYDDGILYDKNRVKVMDYDLSIKKEENRKHFANVDKASDSEFKKAYEDRMTDATELEEAVNQPGCFTLEAFANRLSDLEVHEDIFIGGHSNSSVTHVSDAVGTSAYADTLVYVEKRNDSTYSIIEWYEGHDGELEEGNSYDGYTTIQELYNEVAYNNYDTSILGANGEKPFWLNDMSSVGTADEAFNLSFDDYNVFGEKLTEEAHEVCCICGEPIIGYGNNPEPYSYEGQCCDGCNLKFVLPARLRQWR